MSYCPSPIQEIIPVEDGHVLIVTSDGLVHDLFRTAPGNWTIVNGSLGNDDTLIWLDQANSLAGLIECCWPRYKGPYSYDDPDGRGDEPMALQIEGLRITAREFETMSRKSKDRCQAAGNRSVAKTFRDMANDLQVEMDKRSKP